MESVEKPNQSPANPSFAQGFPTLPTALGKLLPRLRLTAQFPTFPTVPTTTTTQIYKEKNYASNTFFS
jgi:hypothetical protein